jgi:hypothetical protein
MREKWIGLALAATSLGAVTVACDSASSRPKPCEDNNVLYYISGSKADVLLAETQIKAVDSQNYDLVIIKGVGDFFDRVGDILSSQPALYRPGTAALVPNQLDIFSSDKVSLMLLTDKEFQKQDSRKRYQGVLLWTSRKNGEKLEIKIDDIASTKANSSLPNLDTETANKEVIGLSFNKGSTNHSIEELGGGKFELYLQEVDCETGVPDRPTSRLFNLSKSN